MRYSMFLKISVLLLFIFFCNGCSTVSKNEACKSPAEVSRTQEKKRMQNIIFAPAYKPDESDKYYAAAEIYDSSPKASQGLYRYEGLVFVIICIDTNEENIKYLEGSAMLRTADLLRTHYPGLPARFHIRNKLVEKSNNLDTGIYRYATVYREKDIIRKLKK